MVRAAKQRQIEAHRRIGKADKSHDSSALIGARAGLKALQEEWSGGGGQWSPARASEKI